MQNQIIKLCREFQIPGTLESCTICNNGHINTTVIVRFNNDGEVKEYALQKINNFVFKTPEEVMDNIAGVTNFIKKKLTAMGEHTDRKVLDFHTTNDGKYFILDENGDYWRLSDFVKDSVTFNTTDSLTVLEETGKAFGEFQGLLDGYPIADLNIIIPHFHNTEDRYRQLNEAVKNNVADRRQNCAKELHLLQGLARVATHMYQMQKAGELQLRVTHNDTKCNNVLFDKDSGEYLCVIDLDTIMPGLVGFDFGDAVRFACNSVAEDEPDTSRVRIDLNKFKALTKGFMETAGSSLTETEKNTLALGSVTMATELSVRFLTDYLNGDVYFKTDYPEHNLVRAKNQLALAMDMLVHYKDMQAIVDQADKSASTHNLPSENE